MTRPEQQAMRLRSLLQLQGARTRLLPAIEIKPCDEGVESWRTRIGALDAYDFIVFTSVNAVRFGNSLLQSRGTLTLAAIGPATARALSEYGYAVSLQPRAGFTSEALLAHPRLGSLTARRILLIKGAHGRQTLEQEFIRRGAHVLAIDVYQRLPANPSTDELAAVEAEFRAGRLHVITATSLDVGNRLLDIVPDELRAQFQTAHWLVPGERVASGLRARGLQAPLLLSSSAEDQDLVEALLRWRSSESAA